MDGILGGEEREALWLKISSALAFSCSLGSSSNFFMMPSF